MAAGYDLLTARGTGRSHRNSPLGAEDMEGSSFWLVVALPAAMAAAIGVLFLLLKPSRRAAEERRDRMRDLAESLGLRYLGRADAELLRLLPAECTLFHRGDERGLTNLMAEPARAPRLLLFDYKFARGRYREEGLHEEGGGEFLYLVAMTRLPAGLPLTPFRVYQEDWLGGLPGTDDAYRLKPPGDPDLSVGFLFAGEPRQAVQASLTPDLRQAIREWPLKGPKPVIEMVPAWVVVYAESERADTGAADRAASLLRYACRLAQAAASTWTQAT